MDPSRAVVRTRRSDRRPPPRVAEPSTVPLNRPEPTATLATRSSAPLAQRELLADAARAAELGLADKADNTKRAYQSDWNEWSKYAASRGITPNLPVDPGVLAAYVGAMEREGKAVATIRRRCVVLAKFHRDADLLSPTDHPKVRKILKGLARTHGTEQTKKRPMTGAMMRVALTSKKFSAMEKALLATGYVTGLRRSELCALTLKQFQREKAGFLIKLGRTKTDQAGKGDVVAVPRGKNPCFCPVVAIEQWLDDGDLKPNDRVFSVSHSKVARLVKVLVELAGEDPAGFSGHSLRAGLATTAGEHGVALPVSMKATRHKSPTIAAGYVRVADALGNPAFQAAADSISEEE